MKAIIKIRDWTHRLPLRSLVISVVLIALAFNGLAQGPEVGAVMSASDSAAADSASQAFHDQQAKSDLWGYIFAGLGIAGGIAIAWLLAVGASKPVKKPSHAGHHHVVKKR